jgi:dCTP deaminase
MTVLGRGRLVELLRANKLVVSPILADGQIGAASIDLRMGNVVLMVRARGASHVDPALAKVAPANSSHFQEMAKRQKHERHEVPFKSKFLLHPGALALVPTLEWVRLPENVIGTVTARSSWAREGLSIATATLIEPGYEGIVTLELANLGEIPLTLYPGLRIAQIAFALVEGETKRSEKPQFRLSFEPVQGEMVKEDELPFMPSPSR